MPKVMNDRARLRRAYREMVRRARYAPAAVSDGYGNLAPDQADALDSEEHADRYAAEWLLEERKPGFVIGLPDLGGVEALVWTIEAARCICGMQYGTAIKLLRMAADELEEQP